MDSSEAYPEAAAILRAAGWKPHDGWNIYTRDTLVMGFQPDGQAFHVKNWAAIQEGHPQWTADTPDTAEEAAAWLVERFKPAPVIEVPPDAITYTLAEPAEAVETPQHESDGETGEAETSGTLDEGVDPAYLGDSEDAEFLADQPDSSEFAGGGGADLSERVLDADFTIEDLGSEAEELSDPADLPLIEGADLEPEEIETPTEEEAPQGQDRFIGLDDLDRRRSLRIGDVIRYANSLMPRWLPEDDARLATLRNFAMGVSEKRWDDNPANQAELNALETTIRRINEIKNARDAKVEFLEGASREEVEDFAVERDWP